MELAWTVTVIVSLVSGVIVCVTQCLLSAEKASCSEAWKLYQNVAERRDALVEENRELQRRLDTISEALGEIDLG